MTHTVENTYIPRGELAVGVDGSDESFTALKWAMQESSTTGQKVHAIYGWTHSWDLGDEPSSPQEWERVRKVINTQLQTWADEAARGINFDSSLLKLTSVHSAGATALLDIGEHAHQIVVGRRNMGAVARWFLGSMSESLVNQSPVPVTVVHTAQHDDDDIPSSELISEESMLGQNHLLPIVVGVDGSQVSLRALDFAIEAARMEHRELHVIYCWQTKSLAEYITPQEGIPSVTQEQSIAEKVLTDIIDQAGIPSEITVVKHVIHTPAAKGLLEASRYAYRIIVGSRGLGKFNQHVLGSVSQKLLDKSMTTVTVVH
ncbi:universal stress protein [Alloscardovia theropitheci]|uniref:Universal stress protein n=1 Tax=Alloscardovia theropitheci TaxID=2496842 RepID=A0A4R0QUF5_9BIFI|nr:universal stress protein [Alloscardovia theropitheci]TCD53617.1 universal stress protein [Alloscardovia theropitheci]